MIITFIIINIIIISMRTHIKINYLGYILLNIIYKLLYKM